MAKKLIFSFGDGAAEGSKALNDILGGKGANLAEMCNLELPVPHGFTISSELCEEYYKNGNNLPESINALVDSALHDIEKKLGKKLGDVQNPLLVSIRSGSRVSMPGMMDTVLNLGLNDETVIGLAQNSQNPRFAYDSYRRFIQMYSDVVLGVPYYHFEEYLELIKQDNSIFNDADLSVENLKELIDQFKKVVREKLGFDFPQDVHAQLFSSIKAVLDSWMSPRAITYRKLNNIPSDWGTAVTVQSMVFGNMGDSSATGVLFTRNPSNGTKNLYGEYLINAQGEDVVAGIRTPQSITKQGRLELNSDELSLEETMPKVYEELWEISTRLEKHNQDLQDIEFTIEQGKLWILQTRSGKRTTQAALKIAIDLVDEGLVTEETALLRINPDSLNQLLHPMLDPKANKNIIAKGLPASPGAACGKVVFSAHDAEVLYGAGERVILVRMETSPEDIHGMWVAQGILTSRGGMTSHAAVVARGMGKPCIAGASQISIDIDAQEMKIKDITVKAGDFITIDGSNGDVILGEAKTIQPELSEDFHKIMEWSDKYKTLSIRTNAETVSDIKTALNFNADGIGLCRTEHMFFDPQRIAVVRQMIIAKNSEERNNALKVLLPMQRKDFVDIFSIMKEKPVNVRLLDMPLHEFLPHKEEEILELAALTGIDAKQISDRCKQLQEVNPMLGHRGSRLGITYPEIYKMQAQSIAEAMVEAQKLGGFIVNVEIMVPLIVNEKEMEFLRTLIENALLEAEAQNNIKLKYQIGTMIELPRAALCSDKIAQHAEYMSYGTNDLTQTTFGLSRDDSGSFIPEYIEKGFLKQDPFVELDIEGVGELISISTQRARKTNPKIKLGVCGEHGGNPHSIKFFNSLKLDYVSCSPYRVPVARLAAAQAAIKEKASRE